LDLERAEVEANKGELEKARKLADGATSRLAGAESTLRNLKDDHAILSTRHTTEVEQLTRQLSELNGQRSSLEDDLRKEFGRQLKEILAERQVQFDEEKNAGLAELKSVYDEKVRRSPLNPSELFVVNMTD
jgi:uncharacterized phage infection (PIP) family protein YhgE